MCDITVNDAFRPVSRYFYRIWRPEQLPGALLAAMRVLTDPVETGAVTLCFPQDVQAEAFDWPVTRAQALAALDDFVTHRLQDFGRFQDAMWSDEPFLYHALISCALNVKLIGPAEVIAAVRVPVCPATSSDIFRYGPCATAAPRRRPTRGVTPNPPTQFAIRGG